MTGKKPSLTKLESEVMAAIWDAQPDPVSVREILDAINSARGRKRQKKLAYNTVQTIFTLLKQKKALRQVASQGRAHLFQPAISRDQASRNVLRDLSQRMFGGEVQPLIHQLIDEAGLTANELAELREWVDEKLNDHEPQD